MGVRDASQLSRRKLHMVKVFILVQFIYVLRFVPFKGIIMVILQDAEASMIVGCPTPIKQIDVFNPHVSYRWTIEIGESERAEKDAFQLSEYI
jgi:hypothetical protein